MNYTDYKQLFTKVLENENPEYPYDDAKYLNYTKLNWSRTKRWDKQLRLDDTVMTALENITESQHWIIITEPWCGDAAHIIPFLIQMSEKNTLITYEIQQRDSEPFLIDNYLTNNTKSIPKLIAKNIHGDDLFVWGPRPHAAQKVMDEMKAKNADFETTKISLQNWYNEDKGRSLILELSEILNKLLK
ncbi:thioredoxin family protein [Chryseobacterium sp. MYb328]|uniref:thioredoxin family protein n=1 Tax=Chryseobacterium sp. MYb328 TaxID=2745231 RepID=UPI0030A51804